MEGQYFFFFLIKIINNTDTIPNVNRKYSRAAMFYPGVKDNFYGLNDYRINWLIISSKRPKNYYLHCNCVLFKSKLCRLLNILFKIFNQQISYKNLNPFIMFHIDSRSSDGVKWSPVVRVRMGLGLRLRPVRGAGRFPLLAGPLPLSRCLSPSSPLHDVLHLWHVWYNIS